MKASTIETLQENRYLLWQFATALVELYDADRDGDDYWHGVNLPDGSSADLNIWVDGDDRHPTLRVTAYPVNEDGLDTRHTLPLLSRRLNIRHKTNKENNW